jgi:hypothetical protein
MGGEKMKIRTLFWILSLVIVTLLPIHIAMAGVTTDDQPSADLGTIEVGDPFALTFVFTYADSTSSTAAVSTSYDSTLLTYDGFTATMGATDVSSAFTETLGAGSVGLDATLESPSPAVGTLTININFVGASDGSADFEWIYVMMIKEGGAGSAFNNLISTLVIEPVPVEVGWIEGTVTDADTGDPIEGATVSADGESTTTDASGHYSLEVSPGTYDVTAEMTDYDSDTATGVSVADDQTVTQDFALAPEEEPIPGEEHDVQAVSQTVTDNEVMPGDIVDIDVTVRNNGDFTETFDLTCYYDSVEIGTVLVVDLAPGETRVVTFTLNTAGMAVNAYDIEAWADSGEIITEVDEENNLCTMDLKLFIVPEIPLGTIAAMVTMILALIGYVGYKRIKTK